MREKIRKKRLSKGTFKIRTVTRHKLPVSYFFTGKVPISEPGSMYKPDMVTAVVISFVSLLRMKKCCGIFFSDHLRC